MVKLHLVDITSLNKVPVSDKPLNVGKWDFVNNTRIDSSPVFLKFSKYHNYH